MTDNPFTHNYKQVEANSLSEFVEYISTNFLKDQHSTPVIASSESGSLKVPPNPTWLFRGHRNADWDLKPTVYRIPVEYLMSGVEIVIFEEFKRLSLPHLHALPRNDWEWLALAQHHGLPTRLLDWTQNPLAALFFAVENPNQGCDSAIWCYRHAGYPVNQSESPFAVNEIGLFYPPHIAQRITAQSGCFTVHPFVSLTSLVLGQPLRRGPLVKVIVPNSSRVVMRKELEVTGMHRASLFPDLDGIATYIKRVNVPEEDEKALVK
jgi:hypothetical protein